MQSTAARMLALPGCGVLHLSRQNPAAGREKAPETARRRREESSRFLKKAAQKLFLCWAVGVVTDIAHDPN
jgi:hypothetical protein